VAWAVAFGLGLFKRIGLEPDSTSFVKDLIDLAGPLRPLKIVDDHIVVVAEVSLTPTGLCWA
jgi:hypothetical protein